MFKREFKYYKSRCPLPTFDKVIDFNSLSNEFAETVVQRQPSTIPEHSNYKKHGLIEVKCWRIYEFKNRPGLIFITNPFTKEGHQLWVQRCLQDYTKKPNKLNLDPFDDLQPGQDWWETTQNDKERGPGLLKKLRWATLGYHHNWDTKEYSDTACNTFPEELADLSWFIVQALGDSTGKTYRAEAAIVNFYHFDSTLSGHKDVSEPNMSSPLLSISFGQSAIFLVGGETLDCPVTAMFVHSGDMVIMSGPARPWYHGVPRIIPSQERPWSGDTWEHTPYGLYLNYSRINMNIRQVLLPDQHFLINR